MRKNVLKIGQGVFAVAVLGACLVGLDATANNAEAKRPPIGGGGPIYCLDVWRPVICPNGQIYSNDCYAARAGQFGCVPWGGYLQ